MNATPKAESVIPNISHSCEESELIRLRSSTQRLGCRHRASFDNLLDQSPSARHGRAAAGCEIAAEPRSQAFVSQSRGEMTDTSNPFALIDVVNEAVRNSEIELQRNGVKIVRHFHALPMVSVNRPAVLQITSKLIKNAAESVGMLGLGKGSLTLRVEAQQNWVRIEFEDDGIGLARDNIARYFEIGHPSQEREQVAMLQQCATSVSQLRGDLYVLSGGVGRGKTVCLQLPN